MFKYTFKCKKPLSTLIYRNLWQKVFHKKSSKRIFLFRLKFHLLAYLMCFQACMEIKIIACIPKFCDTVHVFKALLHIFNHNSLECDAISPKCRITQKDCKFFRSCD